jgi:hypothetical protein
MVAACGKVPATLAMEVPMTLNPRFSLVGTWRGCTDQTGMDTYYETTLAADMTFATTVRSMSGIMRTLGTYRLLDDNTIEFTNLQKWPDFEVLPGPLIGSPVGPLDYRTARWTMINDVNIADRGTSYFRFVDANTMVVQSPGISPVTFRRNAAFSLPADPQARRLLDVEIPEPPPGFRAPSGFHPPSGFSPPFATAPSFRADPSASGNKVALIMFVAFLLLGWLAAFSSLPR